jgi:hypothetical protein
LEVRKKTWWGGGWAGRLPSRGWDEIMHHAVTKDGNIVPHILNLGTKYSASNATAPLLPSKHANIHSRLNRSQRWSGRKMSCLGR